MAETTDTETSGASEDSYEAMAFSAHLSNRTIAFIYQDGGPRLAGGIYRITFARRANKADKLAFRSPPHDRCPLCDQPEMEE